MQTSYRRQHEAAVRARATRYPAEPRPGRFGLLTTVYIGTDAGLFEETAAALLHQTLPFDEWVILAHGPISPELTRALEPLEADPRIRVLRRPENLGIMGGMRLCLEAARADYVVPLDADDLLTADALQVLSSEIDRHGGPALLYSDEDMLIEGEPRHPYWRPDWDPVLNLASSYVWHLCCIRRDAALAAELYTDAAATWCHDWDSCFRLSRGGRPVHVPEVLYHWRQHPASTTHKAEGPDAGSRQSTRALLERFVGGLADPSLYEVDEFPIFRGAAEWCVRRKPKASPPVAAVGLGGAPALAAEIPATRRLVLGSAPPRRAFGLFGRLRETPELTTGALLELVRAAEEPHLLLIGADVAPIGEDWWWEAVKLFECHPETAIVGGVLTDARGTTRRGIEAFDAAGRLVQPQQRQPADAPGPFALWLKPQCVDVVATDFCFVETALLRRTLKTLPQATTLRGLGMRLAQQARVEGRLTAYSPLVRARLGGASLDGDPEQLDALAGAVLGEPPRPGRGGHHARYAAHG